MSLENGFVPRECETIGLDSPLTLKEERAMSASSHVVINLILSKIRLILIFFFGVIYHLHTYIHSNITDIARPFFPMRPKQASCTL